MIPSQLKRFIEILNEKAELGIFRQVYAISLSTSAMIFDYPAHEYIQAICEDLQIRYIKGFSFDSTIRRELLQKNHQEAFKKEFENIIRAVSSQVPTVIRFQKPIYSQHDFHVAIPLPSEKKTDRRILIITDGEPGSNLDKMTRLLAASTTYESEIVNINNLFIKSACIGCLQCQFESTCIIKDDVYEVYAQKMVKADCVVLAGTLKDHHFGAKFKKFIDRGLFLAKIPKMENKFIVYLVSGPLRQCPIAYQFMDIYSSNRFMINLGCISDEYTDDVYLRDLIVNQALSMDFYLSHRIIRPQTFFSRTYHLMMREILSIVKSVMTVPYKYYVKHKMLDFPNKNIRYRLKGILYNIVFNMPIVKMKYRKNVLQMFSGFYKDFISESRKTE